MTSKRDIDQVVRAWLEEGSRGIPDHVLQAVADQLPRTAQRRSRRQTVRLFSTKLWVAMAGVGLVVALVLGSLAVGRPTPAPTPQPSPQPAWIGVGPSGFEPATTYYFQFPVKTTFRAPAGWQYFETTSFQSVITNRNQTAAVVWVVPNGVYRDPCHWVDASSYQTVGPTVSDLADALAAESEIEPTRPTAASVGGLPATMLTLVPTIGTAGCDLEQVQYWSLERGNEYYCPSTNLEQLYVLDVDGTRLMVALWSATSDPAASADLQQILASIQFPPATTSRAASASTAPSR